MTNSQQIDNQGKDLCANIQTRDTQLVVMKKYLLNVLEGNNSLLIHKTVVKSYKCT